MLMTSAAHSDNSRLMILAAGTFAVILWGATPVVTKFAVNGVEPLSVALLRTLIAAIIALPMIFWAKLLPPESVSGRIFLLVSALGGFVVFPVLFTLGVERTSATHAALILALLPILTGAIAKGLERRWPAKTWWTGSAIAFLGTLLLVALRHEEGGEGDALAGDIMILISCLGASAGYVAGARAGQEAGTWPVTFWGLLIGGLVLLPFVPLGLNLEDLPALPADLWLAVLYLALASSIVAYAAWYWALGRGDTAQVGQLQFAQPLVGLALAALLLSESLTWGLLVAAAMILCGVFIVQRGRLSETKKGSA